MRILILLSLFAFSGIKAQSPDLSNIELTETHYLRNGQLRRAGKIVDGLREGEWKFYHYNGHLSAIGNYVKYQRDGEWIGYHDNSQLEFIGKYVNNKREGEL